MEGILWEYVAVESGVFLSAIVLLLLAFGAILVGYLSDLEKAGKRFFWVESPLPEPESGTFLPKGVGIRHAA
jgi:hypothetical protein